MTSDGHLLQHVGLTPEHLSAFRSLEADHGSLEAAARIASDLLLATCGGRSKRQMEILIATARRLLDHYAAPRVVEATAQRKARLRSVLRTDRSAADHAGERRKRARLVEQGIPCDKHGNPYDVEKDR
jgi:hypothetical protein